jgi:hypothetical protein
MLEDTYGWILLKTVHQEVAKVQTDYYISRNGPVVDPCEHGD